MTNNNCKAPVSVELLAKFYHEWKMQPGHLRFGQAFLSRYFPRVIDPEVFYATNPDVAFHLILQRYATTSEDDQFT